MVDDDIIRLLKMLSEVKLESVPNEMDSVMDDIRELNRRFSEEKPKFVDCAIKYIRPNVTDRAVLRLQNEIFRGESLLSNECLRPKRKTDESE